MNDFWTTFAAIVGALGIVAGLFGVGLRVGYSRVTCPDSSDHDLLEKNGLVVVA